MGKREAIDEEVDVFCDLVKNALCINDVPTPPSDYYFTTRQIRVIMFTNNPFVQKMNQLVEDMQDVAKYRRSLSKGK